MQKYALPGLISDSLTTRKTRTVVFASFLQYVESQTMNQKWQMRNSMNDPYLDSN